MYKWELIECESVKWINLASDSEKWGGLVKEFMSLSVPQNMFCILTIRPTLDFQVGLLHGVGVLYKIGKSVPLQARRGPEGSRKLSFSDFVTTAQDGGRLSALRTGRLYPQGNTPGTHFR